MAVPIPSISGIEAALLLVTDKKKATEYLKQIKDAHDQLVQVSGKIETQNRATKLLREAEQKNSEAEQARKQAEQEAQKEKAKIKQERLNHEKWMAERSKEIEALQNKLSAEKEAFNKSRSEIERTLKARMIEVEKLQDEAEQRLTAIAAHESALKQRAEKFKRAMADTD